MSAFEALFAGRCANCGEWYAPGTTIVPTPMQTGRWQTYSHAECPEVPDPLPGVKPGETACPDCFLIHPVGKCDL